MARKTPPPLDSVSACPAARAHHWRIDTPNGTLANAVCRHCGAERTYYNAHERERGQGWNESL